MIFLYYYFEHILWLVIVLKCGTRNALDHYKNSIRKCIITFPFYSLHDSIQSWGLIIDDL